MTKNPASWKRKLLFFVPVAIGAAIVVAVAKNKTPPPQVEIAEATHKVRVVAAQTVAAVPTAEAFGTVTPERSWNAIAEVAGRIIELDPRVKAGSMVTAGTELVRIDRTDYELTLAELSAQADELATKEDNTRALLQLGERDLALAEQNLQRKRDLLGRDATSQSAVDQEEQAVLAKRNALQALRNTLALIPAEKKALEAKTGQAQRNLEHTAIAAPFDIRIGEVKVETYQYVGVGQTLFSGDAIDRIEIAAQLTMEQLRPLVLGRMVPEGLRGGELGDRVTNLTGMKARVRLDLGGVPVEWPARVVRFLDTIDTRTRTIGVVVAVDDPYSDIEPGARPPLMKGMFVKVILQGAAQTDKVVVPAQAVRDGAVAIAGEDGRLRRKPVDVLYWQGDSAILKGGVSAGERVIVSDLVPTVDGVLVEPVEDVDLATRMTAAALGKEAGQ